VACSKLGDEGIRATISKSRTVTVQYSPKTLNSKTEAYIKLSNLLLSSGLHHFAVTNGANTANTCTHIVTTIHAIFMLSFYDQHKNDTLITTIWSPRQSVHIKNNFTDNNTCHENLICNISNSQKNSLLSLNRYSQVIYPAPG
jgi:hypothetical protein